MISTKQGRAEQQFSQWNVQNSSIIDKSEYESRIIFSRLYKVQQVQNVCRWHSFQVVFQALQTSSWIFHAKPKFWPEEGGWHSAPQSRSRWRRAPERRTWWRTPERRTWCHAPEQRTRWCPPERRTWCHVPERRRSYLLTNCVLFSFLLSFHLHNLLLKCCRESLMITEER